MECSGFGQDYTVVLKRLGKRGVEPAGLWAASRVLAATGLS